MRTFMRGIVLSVMSAAIVAGGVAAPAAAAGADRAPELFGVAVRDWCDYGIMDASAPVYSKASTRSTQTGTLYKGDSIRSQCGGKDIYTGDSYSNVCGGSGNAYRMYTNSDGKARYVPMDCFSG